MLNIFTVAFFGHRFVNNITKVESVLEKMMRKLIEEKEYIDFLVGRNGDFDQCVSSALVRTRRNYYNANSSHLLVLPYATRSLITIRMWKYQAARNPLIPKRQYRYAIGKWLTVPTSLSVT